MSLKTAGIIALGLFIVFVLFQPRSAAHAVQNTGHNLKSAASSVSIFFAELTD